MNKHNVFIVSGGRTGTRFFGDLISSLITNSFSVHEPDVFAGFNTLTARRISIFGLYHMVIGRFLGKTGIRNLTQRYLSGRIKTNDLVTEIKKHRQSYYDGIDRSLIIESYYQWYGLLPVIPRAFDQYKVLCIVRDPRTWVSSWMNFEAHFGKKDLVKKFKSKRLNPKMIGEKKYAELWDEMSQFQKLCWTWQAVYSLIAKFDAENAKTLLVKYEDVFLSDDRDKSFEDVLNFITTFDEHTFPYKFDTGLLQRRVHAAGRKRFPDWHEWDYNLSTQLADICGPLMYELGYGKEPVWIEKSGGQDDLLTK